MSDPLTNLTKMSTPQRWNLAALATSRDLQTLSPSPCPASKLATKNNPSQQASNQVTTERDVGDEQYCIVAGQRLKAPSKQRSAMSISKATTTNRSIKINGPMSPQLPDERQEGEEWETIGLTETSTKFTTADEVDWELIDIPSNSAKCDLPGEDDYAIENPSSGTSKEDIMKNLDRFIMQQELGLRGYRQTGPFTASVVILEQQLRIFKAVRKELERMMSD